MAASDESKGVVWEILQPQVINIKIVVTKLRLKVDFLVKFDNVEF